MARPAVALTRRQVVALRAVGLAVATLLVTAAPLLRGATDGLAPAHQPSAGSVRGDTGG